MRGSIKPQTLAGALAIFSQEKKKGEMEVNKAVMKLTC